MDQHEYDWHPTLEGKVNILSVRVSSIGTNNLYYSMFDEEAAKVSNFKETPGAAKKIYSLEASVKYVVFLERVLKVCGF